MAQMILGSRSTMVTTIVDGRTTWTLADLTAGSRTSCSAARSVWILNRLGVSATPTIDPTISSLVNLAPWISRVRASKAGAALTASNPAAQANMTTTAST
jgi:hypothetical protein